MNNLLNLRKKKRLSQVYLATEIGVAQETVSGYEIGRAYPTVENLLKLAELFQVSTDYLLDRTDIPTPVDRLVIDKLKSKELELMSLYRSLPHDKQERSIGMLMGLAE